MSGNRLFAGCAALILAFHIGAGYGMACSPGPFTTLLPLSFPRDAHSSHGTAADHPVAKELLAELREEKGYILYSTVPPPESGRKEMAEQEEEKQEKTWEMLRNMVITPTPGEEYWPPARPQAPYRIPRQGNRSPR